MKTYTEVIKVALEPWMREGVEEIIRESRKEGINLSMADVIRRAITQLLTESGFERKAE